MRILWALLIDVYPVSDSQAYHVFALNIAEHGVYGWTPEQPGAYWPVGTSAILAGLYMVFGPVFGPVVVLNIVISCAVIVQVFTLTRLYFDTLTGLVAAAIVAAWPSLIMYVTVIASEVFFIFLVLGGLLAFETRWRRPWIGICIAGLFWIAACYVRPVALLVPIIFGVSAILRGAKSPGQAAIWVVAVYVMIACAVAPWSNRNETVFGERVLISTNFGPVFWMGNNPDTDGGYQTLPEWTQGMSETERVSRLKAEAMEYVREEPLAFLGRTAVKFLRMHERESIAVAWNAPQIDAKLGSPGRDGLKVAANGYWYLVLLTALWGVVQLVRRGGVWLTLIHPCFLGWMYFAGVHAVILMGDRYHFPAIPFIAVLSAVGLRSLLPRGNGPAA